MDLFQSALSFVLRLSNLGIPGVWAFHIGSRLPLHNVRPATAGVLLSAAHSSASLKPSFRHAAALESYTEDNFDYYDENDEDIDYPPIDPGETVEGHSRTDASFNSKADPGPAEGGTSSPDSDGTPMPHPAPGDWPSHREPQTKQRTPVGEVEALDFKGPVEPLRQMGNRTPAAPEADAAFLTPGKEGLRNENTQPYLGAGPVTPGPEAPIPPLEGGVLPNYSVSGHVPPLSGGRYVVGVEDHVGANDQGKCFGKLGILRFHLKSYQTRHAHSSLVSPAPGRLRLRDRLIQG